MTDGPCACRPGQRDSGPAAGPNSELNPVQRVWLFLREFHLSHRLLSGCDAIVDALCKVWNQLTPKWLNTLTSYPYIK